MREKLLSTLVAGMGLATAFPSTVWAQSAPPAQPAPAQPTPVQPAPAQPSPKTPAPASAPAGTWASPGPAAPETRRKARVTFEADEPGAVLESDATADGKTAPWYVVCEAPCTRTLPIDGTYRVAGYGYHSSRPFRLPDDQSAVAVKGEMQDSSVAAPMALSIVGGVIASVGLLMMAGGAAREVDHRNGETLIISGAAVGGGGAVIGTIGVVMLLVTSQNTESRAHLTF